MPSPRPERANAALLTRRRVLAVLGAAGLTRCGSDSDIDLTTFKELYARSSQPSSIKREEAARVPYASIGIRVDDGPQNMLVLATATGDDLLWTSSAQVAIVTRAGRILK